VRYRILDWMRVAVLLLAGCSARVPPVPPAGAHFAVIGDYGTDLWQEGQVAQMVRDWRPDYVVTVGDNNYPNGERSTIDVNVGKYYSEFIGHYQGRYGKGSDVNRFWPAIGNHEYYGPEGLQPYLDYFPDLPGNHRYYEVRLDLVHLFVLNSDDHEPDGVLGGSVQAQWLRERIAASDACFKVVVFHHAPFSSGYFEVPELRWPFAEMGADVVLNGHEHYYERVVAGGLNYILNGLGGNDRYGFVHPIEGSVVRFNDDWGALLGFPSESGLRFEFHTIGGKLIDSVTIDKDCGSSDQKIRRRAA
jgi:tartrate-resistant acid phosphatase type 5